MTSVAEGVGLHIEQGVTKVLSGWSWDGFLARSCVVAFLLHVPECGLNGLNSPEAFDAPIFPPTGLFLACENIQSSLMGWKLVEEVAIQLQEQSHHVLADTASGELGIWVALRI